MASGARSHQRGRGEHRRYSADSCQKLAESIRYGERDRDLNVKNIMNDRSGRASGGLILSVVLAAGIIALLIYYITGPTSSLEPDSTAGGVPLSPLLGSVEMTRQQVDQMNRQRSAAAQAVGIRQSPGAMNDLSWRAERDCRDIATALSAFRADVGSWPVRSAADEDEPVDYLYGVGPLPRFSDKARESWGAPSEDLHSYLVSNGPEKKSWTDYFKDIGGRFENWNGPYLPRELADPWGRAYLISVLGFPEGRTPDSKVWCLSAGPNGIIETPASAERAHADDVGHLME